MADDDAKPKVRFYLFDCQGELGCAYLFDGLAKPMFLFLFRAESREKINSSFAEAYLFALFVLVVMVREKEHDFGVLDGIFVLGAVFGGFEGWVINEDRCERNSCFGL